MQGISIAFLCDGIGEEGKRTTSILFNFINLHEYRNGLLVKKMNYFLQQSIAKTPSFSACSFFVVNYSTIFTLVNLTLTYIIVLIQYKNTN